MPCSLFVARVATKPRALMALERPCPKASSESMRRILLDTRSDPLRESEAYGRDTRGVNETPEEIPMWEEVGKRVCALAQICRS
jgi:hypothetical protein